MAREQSHWSRNQLPTEKISFDELVITIVKHCEDTDMESATDCAKCGQRTTAVMVEGIRGHCWLQKDTGVMQYEDRMKTKATTPPTSSKVFDPEEMAARVGKLKGTERLPSLRSLLKALKEASAENKGNQSSSHGRE